MWLKAPLAALCSGSLIGMELMAWWSGSDNTPEALAIIVVTGKLLLDSGAAQQNFIPHTASGG